MFHGFTELPPSNTPSSSDKGSGGCGAASKLVLRKASACAVPLSLSTLLLRFPRAPPTQLIDGPPADTIARSMHPALRMIGRLNCTRENSSPFDGQITYKTMLNRAENHFLWLMQSGQTSHHPMEGDGSLKTKKCVSLIVAASYWPKVAFSASTKPMGKAISDFKGIVDPSPDGMGEVKDSKCPLLKAALAGGVRDPHAEDNSWKILELKAGKTEKTQYDDGTITAVFGTHARDWDPAQGCQKLLKGLEGRELLPCGDADGESSRRSPPCLQVAKKLNVHVKGAAAGSAARNLLPISGP